MLPLLGHLYLNDCVLCLQIRVFLVRCSFRLAKTSVKLIHHVHLSYSKAEFSERKKCFVYYAIIINAASSAIENALKCNISRSKFNSFLRWCGHSPLLQTKTAMGRGRPLPILHPSCPSATHPRATRCHPLPISITNTTL